MPATSKGARGSTTFFVGDQEIRVLYTNRALAEIEANLNKSIVEISQGFSDGKTGIREVATMLRFGMEASRRDMRDGGRSVTMDDAYKILDELGFAEIAAAIIPAIVDMLTPKTEDDDTPK